MTGISTTRMLTSQAHEFQKQYITYDAYSRPEYVYTAVVNAIDGAPCSVVRYAYSGTTTNAVYMKEYESTWQTAWEQF